MSKLKTSKKITNVMEEVIEITDNCDLKDLEIGIGLISCAITYFSDDPYHMADVLLAFSAELRVAGITQEIEDIITDVPTTLS